MLLNRVSVLKSLYRATSEGLIDGIHLLNYPFAISVWIKQLMDVLREWLVQLTMMVAWILED